jgi:hypothetical protein
MPNNHNIPLCDDNCGKQIHPFIPYEALSDSIAASDKNLCIPCFEKRLGRPLKLDDLQPGLTINGWMTWKDGYLVPCTAEAAWDVITPIEDESIRRLSATGAITIQ